MKKLFWLLAVFFLWPLKPAQADPLQWDLPLNLGTVQLPFASTEVFYGSVKPFHGGLLHQIFGASLPVLTLGKLKSGERLIDGSVGAAGNVPAQGAPVDPYLGLGHDFIQDVPSLSQYKSAHANLCTTYSAGQGAWYWGGTFSYAFGS